MQSAITNRLVVSIVIMLILLSAAGYARADSPEKLIIFPFKNETGELDLYNTLDSRKSGRISDAS